jgi:hypothetical protein
VFNECHVHLTARRYQKLGEVWDHQTKDFKVLYKPLYNCSPEGGVGLVGRFEAHMLAVSHFSRWQSKFEPNRVSAATIPAEAKSYLVDPAALSSGPTWSYLVETVPVEAVAIPTGLSESGHLPPINKNSATLSGWGSRTHDPLVGSTRLQDGDPNVEEC